VTSGANNRETLRRGQGKRGLLLTGRSTSALQDVSGQMLGLFSETITLAMTERVSLGDIPLPQPFIPVQ